MNNINPDVMMTRKEAAEYLGVEPRTLANWASAGTYHLPYVKYGNIVRYRKSDLDAFIESRLVDRKP